MREIVYRGQPKSSDKFVFGSFCEPCNIVWEDYNEFYDEQVKPEAVGVYINKDDINGKKIFEGDIVKFKDCFCDDGEHVGYIAYLESRCAFVIREQDEWDGCSEINTVVNDIGKVYDIEVIGNIFDNPLLWRKE